MSYPLINAENIQKHFGELTVLSGVSLSIEAGEVVSVTGPSGAGKTTLLQIIGTLDSPDAGQIIMQDRLISKLRGNALSAFRNRQLGFIFQFHHLLPEFNALENVAIPAFIQGYGKKAGYQKATELLDYLGLNNRLEHKPATLSGGEQQRVAVARALINDPSVVLADEPSGNLDSQTAEELHNLFFHLRKEMGQTFVIVTHNNELAKMADRRLHMVDGAFEGEDILQGKNT